MQTRLSDQDIEDIRVCTLRLMHADGLTVETVAERAHLQYWQVRDFLQARWRPDAIAAALVHYLPIGLVYRGPRVERIPPL